MASQGVANTGLASWGSRLGAALIDGLIQFVVALVLMGPGFAIVISKNGNIFDGSGNVPDDGSALGFVLIGLGFLLYLAFSILYASLFMRRAGRHNGQTPGKQVLGIRVRRDSGEPMGFGWSALREVVVKGFLVGALSAIANLVTFFLLGIGGLIVVAVWYLWPLWDQSDRAPHDMIVSTHVVRA